MIDLECVLSRSGLPRPAIFISDLTTKGRKGSAKQRKDLGPRGCERAEGPRTFGVPGWRVLLERNVLVASTRTRLPPERKPISARTCNVLNKRAVLDDTQHDLFKCSTKETIAVSMSHKAYAFDWSAFARDELHSIILDALSSGDTSRLLKKSVHGAFGV